MDVMKFKTLLTALCFAIVSVSMAAENVEICAKYWRPSYCSWSQGYKVNAYLLDATEMNRATGSYNHSYMSKYILIEWENGGYSAIEIPSYESLMLETEAKDQSGRRWRIKKGWYSCW